MYIYTGKPPPGSRNQWVRSFHGAWLTVSMVTWFCAPSSCHEVQRLANRTPGISQYVAPSHLQNTLEACAAL